MNYLGTDEIQRVAPRILAGLLANPGVHVPSLALDAKRQAELVDLAVILADALLSRCEDDHR